jgi:probable rRNA maturation factor
MIIPELCIEHKAWSALRLKSALQKAATVTAAHLPAKFQIPAEVTVLLTNDAHVRQLNHDFRGIDKPTNVLSFPQFTSRQLIQIAKKGKGRKAAYPSPVLLGDIAIGYQYIVAESKKEHKILKNHVTHLFIHGLLHLFGYDHLHDAQAEKMEKLERVVMAALGLPDPYAGSVHG